MMNGINPQIHIPLESRKYCGRCKILLADIAFNIEVGNEKKQEFVCFECLTAKEKLEMMRNERN